MHVDTVSPPVAVAICTRNRERVLSAALQSFCDMTVPSGLCWEVLVVNNGSSDGTSAAVRTFADRLPVREVLEPVRGLSRARNRALAETRGDVLFFTDDDVQVGRQWLSGYVESSVRWPEAAFFGGPIRPRFIDGRPLWLTDALVQGTLAGVCLHRDLGNKEMVVNQGDALPWGANFGLRIDRLQGEQFREDLGVSGKERLGGEEHDLMQRLLAKDACGVYVPDSVVHHLTPASRLTMAFITRYAWGTGRSQARAGFEERPDARGWALCLPNWHIRRAAKISMYRLLRFPFVSRDIRTRFLYEEAVRWGQIVEWRKCAR